MSEWQRRTAASLRDQLELMGKRQVPSNRDGFDDEFDSLRAVDHRVRCNHDEFYTATLGSNMTKNRYGDVLPNDGTRVLLDPVNSRGDGNYINANYVDGRRLFGVPFVYIATQAPLRNSIGDFWRMVHENGTMFIVMLCAEIENGKAKSERYWPEEVGGAMLVGPLTLVLLSENHRHDSVFRAISIRTPDGQEKQVFHMQYIRWPDLGVPHSSAPLMEMIHAMGQSTQSVRTPIVVHCSGGVGRTGVFITLHVALALFQMEKPISILKIVQHLKFCRSGMVQRKDQYLFAYYAVLREMEKMIWSIESARRHPNNGGGSAGGGARHEDYFGAAAQGNPPNGGGPALDRRDSQRVPQHVAQSFGPPQPFPSRPNDDWANNGPTPPPLPSSQAAHMAGPQQSYNSASSWSGRPNEPPTPREANTDVEAALRNLQLRNQKYRQTPVKSYGSYTSGSAPVAGLSAPAARRRNDDFVDRRPMTTTSSYASSAGAGLRGTTSAFESPRSNNNNNNNTNWNRPNLWQEPSQPYPSSSSHVAASAPHQPSSYFGPPASREQRIAPVSSRLELEEPSFVASPEPRQAPSYAQHPTHNPPTPPRSASVTVPSLVPLRVGGGRGRDDFADASLPRRESREPDVRWGDILPNSPAAAGAPPPAAEVKRIYRNPEGQEQQQGGGRGGGRSQTYFFTPDEEDDYHGGVPQSRYPTNVNSGGTYKAAPPYGSTSSSGFRVSPPTSRGDDEPSDLALAAQMADEALLPRSGNKNANRRQTDLSLL